MLPVTRFTLSLHRENTVHRDTKEAQTCETAENIPNERPVPAVSCLGSTRGVGDKSMSRRPQAPRPASAGGERTLGLGLTPIPRRVLLPHPGRSSTAGRGGGVGSVCGCSRCKKGRGGALGLDHTIARRVVMYQEAPSRF